MIADILSNLLQVDWPALVVGLIVGSYWWRVIRMAAKMRRKTGRAANLVPAEPLGRALRIIWQPVVWLWVALPLVTAWLARPPYLLARLFDQPALRWVAVAVAVTAYAGTRVCWKRMGKSWRMGIDPSETTALVFTGPYALVRHPIYALSSLLMISTVVAVPSLALIIVGILHLLLLQWEARREEANLRRIHGQSYRDYQATTGRFIPRIRRTDAQSPSLS